MSTILNRSALNQPATSHPQTRGRLFCRCPFCDDRVSIPAKLAGRKTLCPECGQVVTVPIPKNRLVAREASSQLPKLSDSQAVRTAASAVKNKHHTSATAAAERRHFHRYPIRDARARLLAPVMMPVGELIIEEMGGGGFRLLVLKGSLPAELERRVIDTLRCGHSITVAIDVPAFFDPVPLEADVIRTELTARGLLAACRYRRIPEESKRRLSSLCTSSVLRGIPRDRGL